MSSFDSHYLILNNVITKTTHIKETIMKIITTALLALAVTASASNALELFAVDKNGDNMISSKEFLSKFAPEKGIETFNFMDKNNDGFVDQAEFWTAMMGQGPLKN